MHISRRKHEAEGVVGVPRELSNGSASFTGAIVASWVIADRPMSAATKLKATSDLRFTKFHKANLRQPNPTRNHKAGCS